MKRIAVFLLVSSLFFSCKKENNTDPRSLPDSYSNQPLGAAAHDLLSAAKFSSLEIQVQYMPGYPLDTTTVANLKNYLSVLCNKQGGITVTQSEIPSNGDTVTVDKAAELERQHRTAYNNGSTLAIYILVTDGYDTSLTTLGFAYRSTSVCVFGKNIYDHSGSIGQLSREALESSVLEHELGHIMGLVNLTTPMQTAHQDLAHGNHCANQKCLMYYAIEEHSGMGLLISNRIPPLDSNCLADLHANGGR